MSGRQLEFPLKKMLSCDSLIVLRSLVHIRKELNQLENIEAVLVSNLLYLTLEKVKIKKADLMVRIEKLIEVTAHREKVWSLLLWERIPEWFAPFKKVVYTSKIKNKVGEVVLITTEKGLMGAETIEMKENEKVVWRYTGGAFTGLETFALAAAKDGARTVVSDILEYEVNDAVLRETVDKLQFQNIMEKSIDAGLLKLKALAEE